MTILDEILAHKRGEVEQAVARESREAMRERARGTRDAPRGFAGALAAAPGPAVIAELKRRSPSRGLIREDFDPVSLASAYAEGGAAALSVLTDGNFFGGRIEYLREIRDRIDVPLLRKDFIIDRYQIDEARAAGADAILLIVAALAPESLRDLHEYALESGLDPLVEVHGEAEMERALALEARLVGVNNRNLATFEVDLAVTERLAGSLGSDSDVLLVAESGIHHHEDILRLERAGAKAFLVGESLMARPDVAEALRELRRQT
jgi:indole-3-glycerol phosphate synthase